MKTVAEIDQLLQDAGPRDEPIASALRTADERRVIQFEDVEVDDVVAKAHGLITAPAGGDAQEIDAAKAVLATVM